jgi:MFS transporter, DHA3 family, macrolide efflux protein
MSDAARVAGRKDRAKLMSIGTTIVGLARNSPYWPVLTHPLLRRVLPGIGLSALGGGMSSVAVSWMALQIAPSGARGTWVALAIAANILPGALGGLLLGRFLNGRSGPQLAGWDALLRAGMLALIPVTYAVGVLSPGLYVGLLGASSVLQAWGKAGRYTMLAELLPERNHLAGNSLVNVMLELSTVFGPLVAALVIAQGGPAYVIAIVAATYAVLAGTYRFALPEQARGSGRVKAGASRSAGFRAMWGDKNLVGLQVLSFGFFFCYGPVTVTIPLYVADGLHASAATLAGFYTAFGIGAVVGALVAGHLQSWPLLPTTIGIVFGFGVALAPIGLGFPTVVSWAAFALCGAIWGPFPTTTTTLIQRHASSAILSQVLAARGALTGLAVPLGAMLGAPAVAVLGARATLLTSSVSITALGVLATVFFLSQRSTALSASPTYLSAEVSRVGPDSQ